MKKKLGRPRRVIEPFVKEPVKKEVPVKVEQPVLCECGNPVDKESSQCWDCSHRA